MFCVLCEDDEGLPFLPPNENINSQCDLSEISVTFAIYISRFTSWISNDFDRSTVKCWNECNTLYRRANAIKYNTPPATEYNTVHTHSLTYTDTLAKWIVELIDYLPLCSYSFETVKCFDCAPHCVCVCLLRICSEETCPEITISL